MKDTAKFCENTIPEKNGEINVTEEKIKNQLDPEEYNEIKTKISKYNDQKVQELRKIKTAKYRKLRWNLTIKRTNQTTNDKDTATSSSRKMRRQGNQQNKLQYSVFRDERESTSKTQLSMIAGYVNWI